MKDDLRYVGQTSKDAIHRFMEHIQQAKRQSNSLEYNQAMKQKLLYTHMLKIGLDNWRVYPLEHIPASDKVMFKKLANTRELDWMIQFNTGRPNGLNMIHPVAMDKTLENETVKEPVKVSSTEDKKQEMMVTRSQRKYDSRNYPRRIRYLNKLIIEEKFNYKILDMYTVKNLQEMLKYLENRSISELHINIDTASILRPWIKSKLQWPSPQKVKHPYRIWITLAHDRIQDLNIGQYFININWMKLLPEVLLGIRTQVNYKYVPTMGRKVFNYMQWRDKSFAALTKELESLCICETRTYDKFRDINFGHVITMDCELCTDTHLQNLLKLGASFRPTPLNPNKAAWYAEVRTEFDKIIDVWCKAYTIHTSSLMEWKLSCLEDVKRNIDELNCQVDTKLTWLPKDTESLRSLHNNFIIMYVDKAANNFTFVCKRHYIQQLIKEYSLPTYQVTTLSENEIIEHHLKQTKAFGIRFKVDEYKKVAYAYMSHKATKLIADVRFIAGSYMCSLQPLSLQINKLLNALKPKLYQLWNTRLKNSNIQIWMMKNSLEIPERIKRFNRSQHEIKLGKVIILETYDVKTLYTNIPHADLLRTLGSLFKQLEGLNRNRVLTIGQKGQCFKLTYGNKIDLIPSRWDRLYSLQDLENMIEFLINNTYITLANKCFIQQIGIPMGTNAGVNLVTFINQIRA